MEPKFYRKVLPNGMVVILEKREIPVVSVAFAVRCGGLHESSEEKGISHFIEHLLYKGTPKRNAKKIAEEIERKGGVLNGFTDESMTAFWCKMPSRHLNVALDVLGDMVRNPLFNEKEIDKERHVIFEEMKMYKDNPTYYVLEKMHSSLYGGSFGIPLIGTEETLNAVTREKILERFDLVYQPKNMILCVVGDCEFEDLIDFVEKNFSFKKRMGKIPLFDVVKQNKSALEERSGVDQANLVFSYHVPVFDNGKSYASGILNILMSEGMSSRLFHEIREKRNLAYSVKGGSEVDPEFAYNFVYVGTKKENVEKIKKIILEEFKKVSEELSEEELNQIKEEAIGNLQISMEDSQEQMCHLLNYETSGNAEMFYEIEEKVKAVTLKDVKNLARKAMNEHSFFALVPKEE
ncbi:MAG: pitrilysin family protein [Nanoarchaeota archaeon]|nr:pitrilysin family protein [Nanoarchaeota archaeon]